MKKKTRIWTAIILTVLLMIQTGIVSFAGTLTNGTFDGGGVPGTSYSWSIDGDTLTISPANSGITISANSIYPYDAVDPDADGNGYFKGAESGTSTKKINEIKTLIINNGIKVIGYKVFRKSGSLTSVTLPSTLEFIEADAFYKSAVREFNIPAGVKNIGLYDVEDWNENYDDSADCDGQLNGALFNTALKSINVDNGNRYYSSEDGVLFNKGKTILYAFPPAKDTEDHIYYIPDTVNEIHLYAFHSPRYITGVFIPKSVKKLGLAPFGGESGDDPDSSIKDVYYEGSEAEWKALWGNESSYQPVLHYDSKRPGKSDAADPASEYHETTGAGIKPTAENAKYEFDQKTMKTLVAATKVDVSERIKEAAVSGNSAYSESAKHRYRVSDKKCATIDKKGRMKPKKSGEIDVWTEQKEKGSDWQQVGEKVHLFVQNPKMEKKAERTLKAGDTIDAYEFLSDTSYSPTKWISSKESVATVDEKGIITVKKKGTTKIIAQYGENKDSSKKKYKTTLKIKMG